MTTIVMANQKGGVGKSTLSCLLVWWLAQYRRQRVLLIDLDTQGNASRTMAAHRCPIPAHAFFGATPLQLASPIADPAPSIMLIAATANLAEVDAIGQAPAIFRRQFELIRDAFDAIVIDTPPALGRRMLAALIVADFVGCPIELEDYSVDGLSSMLKTVFGVKERWNPRLQLAGIIANRFNHHSAAQARALEALLSRYSEFVLPGRIATRSAIPEALAQRLPVWKLPKSSARAASAEILHVFEQMDRRMGEGDPGRLSLAKSLATSDLETVRA